MHGIPVLFRSDARPHTRTGRHSRGMIEEAPGVWRLPLVPRDGVNAYLLGDVLVDAGMPQTAGKLVAALRGRSPSAHALTHAHVDHAGGSKRVADELGLQVWASSRDAQDVAKGTPTPGPGRFAQMSARFSGWPAVPVARSLEEGDEVAGFRVVDAPGHTPGHIAFFRESDRVLVGGDAFTAMGMLTTRRGVFAPPAPVNFDDAQVRRTMRKLADLEPSLALFGHGPAVRDAAAKLRTVAGAAA